MRRLLPATVLLLGSAGLAQSTIVSPTVAATSEGAGGNLYPFFSNVMRRYQQIHGDLGPGAKAIKSLTFRLNAGTGSYTNAWTIDLEMFMGANLGVTSSSQFFDRNYTLPRTNVIARKVVNWGPIGNATMPGPVPFNPSMALTLDTPYGFGGAPLALVWEVVIHNNAGAATVTGLDADVGTTTSGVGAITGTGCTVTGRAAPMTHGSSLTDIAGVLAWSFTVTNGPSGANVLLALGTTNPALQFPGLCSSLFTDLAVSLPIGATDGTGAITTNMSGASTFVLKNTLPNAVIYTQVHALDAGQAGLPIANSDGRSMTVPTSNLTRVCDVMRVFNDVGGTTALEGRFFPTVNVGYALVTQFTY
jgi:hypothetical protein